VLQVVQAATVSLVVQMYQRQNWLHEEQQPVVLAEQQVPEQAQQALLLGAMECFNRFRLGVIRVFLIPVVRAVKPRELRGAAVAAVDVILRERRAQAVQEAIIQWASTATAL
jgi:hypothetical protein